MADLLIVAVEDDALHLRLYESYQPLVGSQFEGIGQFVGQFHQAEVPRLQHPLVAL